MHVNFSSYTSTNTYRKTSFDCRGKLAFPLAQATVHIKQHSTIGGKVARASFPSCTSTGASRTTLFHHEGKLACVSFPSCIRTNASPTTSFHHRVKLASFHHGVQLLCASFSYCAITSASRKHHSTMGES
jgi:hypothetical protein